MFMEKILAIPKPKIGVRILLSRKIGVKKHDEDFLILTVLFCLFMSCWILAFLNFIRMNV
ncbi:hypothetical protein DXA46_07730 [Bacteroides sp. OF02-3LB]|nr:hypothetical protein DWY71_17585 [Bacteroides sp. AF26-7BH]RGY34774.1 hypothetical protein DXA46_07730 [Bacteroides sp. OF02-3LB]